MTQLSVVSDNAPQVAPLSPSEIKTQVQLIQQVMQAVMKKDEHYGTIPGTNRAVLLKPGAEKLSMTFRLRPRYRVEVVEMADGHRNYDITCEILGHDGTFQGEGLGCCSTMESKYRWRSGDRECPKCGTAAVIKGKQEFGGGWLCWKKKDGCGEKFDSDDTDITSQKVNIENAPADFYNTCLKMSKKRAFVDAILTATAASDIFTQDVGDDDTPPAAREAERKGTRPTPPPESDTTSGPKSPPAGPRQGNPPPEYANPPHAIFSDALGVVYNDVRTTFESEAIAKAAITGILEKHGFARANQVPRDNQELMDTILAEVQAHAKVLIESKNEDPLPPATETSPTQDATMTQLSLASSDEPALPQDLLAKLRQSILDTEAKLPELLVEELRKKFLDNADLDSIDDDMALDRYFVEIDKEALKSGK